MIENILYAILAILGLSFLIFIHELGHYIVAKRQGMRIEAFSIGFGKPLLSWIRGGVQWKICMLPFGGYVKIAGMQKEKGIEPSEIPDGFYAKTPWQRIKVALAGPMVNIVFALVLFAFLWFSGGRNKNFSEFTHRIGWVDPKSTLYEKGVRPGDVITQYDGRDFHGFKDLLMSSIMNQEKTQITGYKINYKTGNKEFFDYTLPTYSDPRNVKENWKTIGVLSPAQYLIYDKSNDMLGKNVGFLPQDRLIWADGEILFSLKQLSSLVNNSTAFLTIERNKEVLHSKVPRVKINELRMSAVERAEIDDWQHEAALKGSLQDLYFIPYNLSPTNEVEGRIAFIDEIDQRQALEGCERCDFFLPLQEGDQILAIDGTKVENPYQLLDLLQTRRVLLIVDRDPKAVASALWSDADTQFESFNKKDLQEIISSIGLNQPIDAAGKLHLLSPIQPKMLVEMPFSIKQKAQLEKEIASSRKIIEKLSDTDKKNALLQELEMSQKKLILGLPLKDRQVQYNPDPLKQFTQILSEAWRTISGLFSGGLNPKYLSGPVGIVHGVHQSWLIGFKEAIFWMAVVSLNLGIINLLPIPVLDGGHIMFSLYERITKRRLSAKTMERLIFPFIVCLIGFFIYVTYQDLSRLFSKFF